MDSASTNETERLAQIAVIVCQDWQLIDPDESILGDRVDGALEHLIHEMCHAASLGIEWGPEASRTIGDRLSRRGSGAPSPMAIAEESRTWAIEWNVWDFFDFEFEWGDLEVAAEVQSCDPDEIKDMVNHSYIEDFAGQVYMDLVRFLNEYERKLQETDGRLATP